MSLCILARFSQHRFLYLLFYNCQVILAAAGQTPGSDLSAGKRLGQQGDWSCSEPPWHSCLSCSWVSFLPAGLEAVVCCFVCPKMLCWAPAIWEQLGCLQGGWQVRGYLDSKALFLPQLELDPARGAEVDPQNCLFALVQLLLLRTFQFQHWVYT